MDNYHAELIAESNRRLIEALGMHWENQSRKFKNESPAYTESDFSNIAQTI